ncbi:hypothetical protein GW17_00061579 [Ensete ventricosum]|nr:hypothetical protein GW17_00061579 [Ensete ventricosum]RZS11592.1 hypothetical protein BHM03_00042943 [Ensete ventricosum]
MPHRRQYHKGSSSSHTMLALLRKDLRDGNLQALPGRTSFVAPCLPMAAPDPFISSLIYRFPLGEASKDLQPECFSEGSHVNKSSDEKVIERYDACSFKFLVTLCRLDII